MSCTSPSTPAYRWPIRPAASGSSTWPGTPAFARFDAGGTLLFHRVMQGREIDPLVEAVPKVWPRRAVEGTRFRSWRRLVRTAAVDPGGRLWVSFVVPYTYVFDGLGEKVRTVQFQAAGVVSPDSLFFPAPGRLLVTPGCFEFAVR